ncbi:MAG: hypothetical protein HKM02_12745 [Pseudomonadales bacterium]|nr:hypothetical protein [Pseudomonadales bacterium]
MKPLSMLLGPACCLVGCSVFAMEPMNEKDMGTVVAQDGIDISNNFQSTSIGFIAFGSSNGLDSSSSTPALTQWQGLAAQGSTDVQISMGSNSAGSAAAAISLSGNITFNPVTVYNSAWDGTQTSLTQSAINTGASTEFTYNLGQVSLNLNYLITQGFSDQTNGYALNNNGITLLNAGCTGICTQLNNPSWSQGTSSFGATSVAYEGMSPVKISIGAANATTLATWKSEDSNLATSLGSNSATSGLLISMGAISGSRVVTGATGTGTTGNYTQSISIPATNLLIANTSSTQQVMQAMAQLSNALGVPSLLGPGSLFK